MEVKLSYRRHPFLVLPKSHSPNPNLKTNFPSQSLKWWVNSKRSFKKCFTVHAERWRFHNQEMSKGDQSSTKHYLVHVVKEGETLSSISKQYGVSMPSIAAANKNISDVDLVFKGQLLSIPASSPADSQGYQQQQRFQGSMNILDGFLNQKSFIMLTAHGLPHAKSTGYFLVLVPLIAFCIRCIVDAFNTRARRDLGRQALNQSRKHHDGSRNMRWKYALSDIREPDNYDSESIPDSNGISADQDQNSFEDISHSYSKLEHDYQKFLSECGISKWGYWRGGSHE